MEPANISGKKSPELVVQQNIVKMLAIRGWVTIRTHGNSFQKGFPDLYCLHHLYGALWVEVKLATGSILTKAQLTIFPRMSAAGHGIWVLKKTGEEEYAKLFKKENWASHLLIMNNRGLDKSTLVCEVNNSGPEARIQNAIMARLREGCPCKDEFCTSGWTCLPTHGNMYQQGLPDVYALHPRHGGKWIEVKQRTGYRFTSAQKQYFPIIANAGHGIWVIMSENDLGKLFEPCNWANYMYGPRSC